MKRTRKWAYVEQEAKRLVNLGLSKGQIAQQLGVDHSTVQRWMKSGKLVRPQPNVPEDMVAPAGPAGNPEAWGAAVREAYALDATDEELVTLAVQALAMAHDSRSPTLQLAAMGRFQGIVKQLALAVRATKDQQPVPDPTPRVRIVRRGTGDPRQAVLAVSA